MSNIPTIQEQATTEGLSRYPVFLVKSGGWGANEDTNESQREAFSEGAAFASTLYEKEIERLKKLILSAHVRGWMDFPEENDPPFTVAQSWDKFCIDNNIK